jgi:CheY-like chemotaxis protein
VSTTRKFGGTGLGLAIAQRTVQALGGAMTFESVEGRGSIFRFSIPFRNPQQSPIITWCLRLPRFEGLSIGVVDDNQVDRNGMVEQLQKWGLEATGYECPAGIREHELLLVTNRLKEHVHCACPVICLYRVTESIENGPSLRKPCHPQLLLSAVSNELSAVSPVSVNQGADNSRGSLVNHSPVQSLLSTILVVEDNPVNQRVAELLLSKLGHEYHITNNGAEALNALEKCPYDLVLMDCEMPVMDGFAAAAAIRKIEGELLHTPIVAMTAHALEGDRQRCVESGMDDYLSKPIDQRRLSVMIDKWSTPLNSHRLEFVKRDLGSDCVVDLMREFARDTGNVVEMAKQIISGNGAQDLQALAKAVHFLKGCCQYCGAQRLYGICKRICAACKTGEQADFEQISWLCRKLIAEYDAAVAAMAEFSP